MDEVDEVVVYHGSLKDLYRILKMGMLDGVDFGYWVLKWGYQLDAWFHGFIAICWVFTSPYCWWEPHNILYLVYSFYGLSPQKAITSFAGIPVFWWLNPKLLLVFHHFCNMFPFFVSPRLLFLTSWKLLKSPQKRGFFLGFPGDDGEVQEVRRGQRW